MPLSIERNNYKTGLFLEEVEFKLEQQYHSLLRRRLNFGLFERAGILIGLDLSYDGVSGTVTVQPGVAIVRDAATQEGKELMIPSAATVSVAGPAGSSLFIVLGYQEANGPDKPPVTAARIQEISAIQAQTVAPADINLNVVLGQITIGTALVGVAPGRQIALVRASLLGVPVPPPGLVIASVSGSAGGTVTVAVVATGSFTLTGLVIGEVTVSTVIGLPAITVFAVSAATTNTANVLLTVPAAAVGSRTLTITKGGVPVSASFSIPAGLTVASFTGVDLTLPTPRLVTTLVGTGFRAPLRVEFSSSAGGFTVAVDIPSTKVAATEVQIESAGSGSLLPPNAINGPVRVTILTIPGISGDTVTSTPVILPPVITNFTPTSASSLGTTLLTINGKRFSSPNLAIRFKPYDLTHTRSASSSPAFPAATESVTDEQIKALVPPGSQTGGLVQVSTDGGIVVSALPLTVS